MIGKFLTKNRISFKLQLLDSTPPSSPSLTLGYPLLQFSKRYLPTFLNYVSFTIKHMRKKSSFNYDREILTSLLDTRLLPFLPGPDFFNVNF